MSHTPFGIDTTSPYSGLDSEIRGEVYGGGLHAWVEAEVDHDNGALYDPSHRFRIERVPRDLRRHRRAQNSHFGTGKTQVVYTPNRDSAIIGVQIPLTRGYLREDLSLIRGAIELLSRSV